MGSATSSTSPSCTAWAAPEAGEVAAEVAEAEEEAAEAEKEAAAVNAAAEAAGARGGSSGLWSLSRERPSTAESRLK